MLDIQLIREHPDVVKTSTQRKGIDPSLVDQLLQADRDYRGILLQVEELRAELNRITKATRARPCDQRAATGS